MDHPHDELMKLPEHELLPADDPALDELNKQTKSLSRELEPEERPRPKLPKKLYAPTIKGRAFDIMHPTKFRSPLQPHLKTAVPDVQPSKRPNFNEESLKETDLVSSEVLDHIIPENDELDFSGSAEEVKAPDDSADIAANTNDDGMISSTNPPQAELEESDQRTNIFDTDNYHVPLPAPQAASHAQSIILTILLFALVSIGLLFTYLLLN